MADDFGGKPWQGRPKGGYWLPKEFHTWPEIRAIGLSDLGAFIDMGMWASQYPTAHFGREMVGYMRGQCRVPALIERGLWYSTGPKTYKTKTMSELRIGRGTRGLIFNLSRLLPMSPGAMRVGLPALGVYALTASWSLTTDRPGYIPTEVATQFGKPKHVSALWDGGLWLVREAGFCMSKGDHPLEELWRLTRDDERAPIAAAVRARVMERCGSRCVRCGALDDLALDHIYPWSLGGPDDEDNLQVLCKPCNSAKGARVEEKGVA